MSKTGKQLDKILNSIYEELYQNATPKASFKELLKNAEWIDKDGNPPKDDDKKHLDKWYKDHGYKKDIHYKNFVIPKEKADKIIKNKISSIKDLTPFDVRTLMVNIERGCGPLTDEEKEKDNK